MNKEIYVGMRVYCDLHSKSKIHIVTGIKRESGWVIIDNDFHWPLRSVVPVESTRRCAICCRPVTSGFLFDGKTCLCERHCAAKFFDNDEGCVDILIDSGRLVWHDSFERRTHYRANYNHYATECFHHFDDEKEMYKWVSEKIGRIVTTMEDVDKWTDEQNIGIAHRKGYVDILHFNVYEFYENRRKYVELLRKCNDLQYKAQKTRSQLKRMKLLDEFKSCYEDAQYMSDIYPEVWQGEI